MASPRICSVEGCGKRHFSRGWCRKHYYALRIVPACIIDGCRKRQKARGWCAAHYKRWSLHGDPLGGGTPVGEPGRFYREIVLTYDGDDCLIWPYTRNNNGYAQLYVDGRQHLVSRLVCKEAHGPPPTPEHEAAHDCGKGTQGCVNRQHVVWKTRADNMADLERHGTVVHGERSHLSRLTEAEVRRIRALEGKMLHREIADIYSVSPGAVQAIFSGKSWRRVE